MISELQKVLDKLASGSLIIDESRNELSKIQTSNDSEVYMKKNMDSRLAELLVRCVCLQDEINEFIEDGVILSPEDQTEFLT